MESKLRRDRKYKAFLIVFFIASLMLAFGKLTGDHWVYITGVVFVGYMGGNIGEHFSKRGNGNGQG